MTLYQRYKKLDVGPRLGLEPGNARSDYFCTPKGAKVIGWEGVDSIHYCFIRDFGDMVFAVNPSNLPGDHVHPLARSFEDFLRLLLACGGTAAIEQAWMWNRGEFDAFLETYPPGPEQRTAMDTLRDKLALSPMDDPYGYIREVQFSFDYHQIPYRKGYHDSVPEESKPPERPEWKVYFDGSSGQHHRGHNKPGKEVPINAQFTWGGRVWHVPAVYLCGQGLVMDLCMEIDPGEFRAFLAKWAARAEADGLTLEEQERMTAENPQVFEFEPMVSVNGRELHRQSGSGFGWVPPSCCLECEQGQPNQQNWGAIWLMEHYGLDPEQGWWFSRESFPWATKATPALRTLVLRMSHWPQPLPGPRFIVHQPGDAVPFIHPITQKEHTLRVVEYGEQEMDPSRMPEGWEYPTHYTAMSYVVEPELPRESLTVRDCGEGDRPCLRQPDPSGPAEACSVGIIGGTYGPTAILLANGKTGHLRTACSALRFAPPERIEWRMVFRQKAVEDMETILPLPHD